MHSQYKPKFHSDQWMGKMRKEMHYLELERFGKSIPARHFCHDHP